MNIDEPSYILLVSSLLECECDGANLKENRGNFLLEQKLQNSEHVISLTRRRAPTSIANMRKGPQDFAIDVLSSA